MNSHRSAGTKEWRHAALCPSFFEAAGRGQHDCQSVGSFEGTDYAPMG